MPSLQYPPSISAYIQGKAERPNYHVIWTMPNNITLQEAIELQRLHHCCICRSEKGKAILEYTCSRRCYKVYARCFEYFHWQLKSQVIKRDGMVCRRCSKRLSKTVNEGTDYEFECPIDGEVHVDHIMAIKDGGPAWDAHNMQVLCKRCHAAKTGREARRRAQGERIKRGAAGFRMLDGFC